MKARPVLLGGDIKSAFCPSSILRLGGGEREPHCQQGVEGVAHRQGCQAFSALQGGAMPG